VHPPHMSAAEIVQTPRMQSSLAPQALPQDPQLFVSLWKLLQVVPH
jgi:hypothetical protein